MNARSIRRRARRGFTLVEILIVVVILGILAAVVIPQFVNASDEAQVGNIETQLRTLRTQIQLFRAQSDTNAFPEADTLWDDLVGEGLIQTPPINPRSNSDAVVADGGDADAGWIYDEASGQLWANLFNEDYRQDDTDAPWGDDWADGVDFGGGADDDDGGT